MPEVLLPWLSIENEVETCNRNSGAAVDITVTVTTKSPGRVEVTLPFLGSDYKNTSLGNGDVLPWLSLV